jgi:acyl-CoA reductase-like NAD-dependent aldehyde dehydrogenase
MEALVSGVRAAFKSGVTKPLAFREEQLKALKTMVLENEARIVGALKADLGKCESEAFIFEVDQISLEVNDTLRNLHAWTKPEYVHKTLLYKCMSAYVQRDPYGVVLVIGAWNYPVQLTLLPLIGAIAAGNVAIIKPSEVAQKTAEILAELIPKYLNKDCYKVVCGGVAETTDLLNQNFDFICYTGNSAVARIVMTAAAKNLTPVMLELGGKSPVYVDETANLTVTANRVAWGKFVNAGQTCIAPDYVFCHEKVYPELLEKFKASVTAFYGEDISKCADYGRIVNEKHWDRVDKHITEEGVEVLFGGQKDKSDKFIAPTIVKAKDDNMCMKEEIFGPVLPIRTVKNADEALDIINARPKPLSLYVFADDKKMIERFRIETSSGMFVANDTVVQGGLGSLPFGGVGESGMGAYHGKFSIDSFSHLKSCMEVPTSMIESANYKMRYPPYTESKVSWARYIVAGKGSLCNIL